MPDERFRPTQRLLGAADFQHVFKTARRSRDSFFTVLAATGPGERARLGLAVSKKTDKRAVVRNRIKRIVRESFRRADLPEKDFVVISQPSAARASSDQLSVSLQAHWQRLGKNKQQQRQH